MRAFTGIQDLKALHIRQTAIETLSGIENFPAIERIGLDDVLDGDLTPLLHLPQLKEVYLDEGLRKKAEKDLARGVSHRLSIASQNV